MQSFETPKAHHQVESLSAMIAEARTEGEPLGEEDPDMKETESMLILMQQI